MPRRPLPPPEHPWEQQPDESHAAFQIFTTWLALPNRSISQARSEAYATHGIQLSEHSCAVYSSKYRWRERGRAWDLHVDRQRQVEYLEEARKTDERIARASNAQTNALVLPSLAIQRKMAKARELGIDVLDEMAEAPLDTLLGMAVAAARVFPGVAQTEQATRRASIVDGGPQDAEPVSGTGDEVAEVDRVAAMYAFMEEEGVQPRKQLGRGKGEARRIKKQKPDAGAAAE